MSEIRTDYSSIHFQDNGKLKLLIIVGTRPEIIRLAAVINKCRKYFDVVLAHTGQNYDYTLNGIFFENLKIAEPEVYMDAVGDDLGATVGNIINCSYKLMSQIHPEALLILGDTNLRSPPSVCIFRSFIWKPGIAAKTNVCRKKQTAGSSISFLMSTWRIPSMRESICMNAVCRKSVSM